MRTKLLTHLAALLWWLNANGPALLSTAKHIFRIYGWRGINVVLTVAVRKARTLLRGQKLRLLNAVLDGRGRRFLEGKRQKLDPWGSWMHSSLLDVAPPGVHETDETRSRLDGPKGANLLFSERDGLHLPMFDIDLPMRVVPSTTPGRGHLYINKPMPWSELLHLLNALVRAGIVHRAYLDHSERRGYTCLRPAFVRKRPTSFSSDFENDDLDTDGYFDDDLDWISSGGSL